MSSEDEVNGSRIKFKTILSLTQSLYRHVCSTHRKLTNYDVLLQFKLPSSICGRYSELHLYQLKTHEWTNNYSSNIKLF